MQIHFKTYKWDSIGIAVKFFHWPERIEYMYPYWNFSVQLGTTEYAIELHLNNKVQ